MSPSVYFQVFMYTLMVTLIIALVLIFLNMLYGGEEKERG